MSEPRTYAFTHSLAKRMMHAPAANDSNDFRGVRAPLSGHQGRRSEDPRLVAVPVISYTTACGVAAHEIALTAAGRHAWFFVSLMGITNDCAEGGLWECYYVRNLEKIASSRAPLLAMQGSTELAGNRECDCGAALDVVVHKGKKVSCSFELGTTRIWRVP